MIELEEENILVEGKTRSYMFSFDNNSSCLYIDIYDKEKEEIIREDTITNQESIQKLHSKVSKPPGTVITDNNKKYLVRNHDKCYWSEDTDFTTKLSHDNCSINNPYDTRYTGKIGIVHLLKRAWFKIIIGGIK